MYDVRTSTCGLPQFSPQATSGTRGGQTCRISNVACIGIRLCSQLTEMRLVVRNEQNKLRRDKCGPQKTYPTTPHCRDSAILSDLVFQFL